MREVLRSRGARRGIGIVVLCLVSHATAGCARTQRIDPAHARFVSWTGEGFQGRRIRTGHFEILSTVADAEFERGLPTFLEAAYRQYASTLPVPGSLKQPLTTYVFGLRDEWSRFAHARYPLRNAVYSRIRSGGFTERTTSVSFYASRGVTLATLAHEGWHQYVNARIDRPIPAWINEGLACVHESFDLVRGAPRFAPRRNTFRVNSLRDAVQRDTLLPLAEILDTDAGEVIMGDRTGNTDTYYAQAWALITLLRYGGGGRYASAFHRMLKDIGSGAFPARVSAARVTDGGDASITDGRAAFIAYFGTAPESMQDEYYDHLIRVVRF